MARVLTPSMLRAALAAAALLHATAHAVGPKDPFTPPGRAPVVVPDVRGSATSTAGHSGLTGLRFGRKPQALIDGEWVALGQTVRGARLARLRPQHALLVHPDGREERLSMFPADTPASAAASAASAASSADGALSIDSVAPASAKKETSP
jgi:hypothetical protein